MGVDLVCMDAGIVSLAAGSSLQRLAADHSSGWQLFTAAAAAARIAAALRTHRY